MKTSTSTVRKPITIKISKEERNIIEAKAHQANLSPSTYIRETALGSTPKDNLSRSKIAKVLCILYNQIEDLHCDQENKAEMKEVLKSVWPLIK